MGWRDRDWAKFDENELGKLLGPSAPRRRTRVGTLGGGHAGATFLAAAVSGVAILFTAHLLGKTHMVLPKQAPSNSITIHFRPTDLGPATRPGRICLTAPGHGRFCASYSRGESPATELTKKIERTGLDVDAIFGASTT